MNFVVDCGEKNRITDCFHHNFGIYTNKLLPIVVNQNYVIFFSLLKSILYYHVTQYTDISFVRSATNIFCVSEVDEIQLIFDPCWTSWATQTELACSTLFSAADVPLHLPLLRLHRTSLQSSPPDTSMSFGLNLAKWTWDALEECFLRHSSGTNFFFPSNLKSWMLPLPENRKFLCCHSLLQAVGQWGRSKKQAGDKRDQWQAGPGIGQEPCSLSTHFFHCTYSLRAWNWLVLLQSLHLFKKKRRKPKASHNGLKSEYI